MIDIGVNLTHKSFAGDLDAVLTRAWQADISAMLVTGTDLSVSTDALTLCERYAPLQRLYCTAGVHPHHADIIHQQPDWLMQLRALLLRAPDLVRSVGETGLDFNRNFSPRPTQIACFEAQIALAADTGLSLFVHDRDSQGLVGTLLDNQQQALTAAGVKTLVHCFTGNQAELEAHLAADRYIGITGWVADERRGQSLAALVPSIPLTRLLIETDAPFLVPRNMPQHRRYKRNEPAFLIWVARQLASLRQEPLALLQAATTANARTLLGLSAALEPGGAET